MPDQEKGLLKFSLNHSEYAVTWGSKAIWCELCELEKKGDPAEVGSTTLGVYWVRDGDPVHKRAIDHMIEHVNE